MGTNRIPELQNQDAQIRLQRARRAIYARCKMLLILQISLTVLLPVLGAFAVLLLPGLKGTLAFVSICVAVIDVTVLDRVQRTHLKIAAKIAEQFDCTVLELPWDGFTVGAKIAPETIHSAGDRHLNGKKDPQLKDWYPKVVGTIPIHLARIICQRTNLWYDAHLRRRYGEWVLSIVIGLCIVVFLIGLAGSLTVDAMVLGAFAPMTPIVIWGVREYLRQRDAVDAIDRLRSEAEGLWDKARKGECSEAECAALSRQFQNAIYDRRSSSPLIFDWIYQKLRPKLEKDMVHGASDFVRQVTGA
jgi:hypothetical protein